MEGPEQREDLADARIDTGAPLLRALERLTRPLNRALPCTEETHLVSAFLYASFAQQRAHGTASNHANRYCAVVGSCSSVAATHDSATDRAVKRNLLQRGFGLTSSWIGEFRCIELGESHLNPGGRIVGMGGAKAVPIADVSNHSPKNCSFDAR